MWRRLVDVWSYCFGARSESLDRQVRPLEGGV